MRTDMLFGNFEMLADAPNGIPKLRERILHLAVQGKLVAQDPNEEPAIALIEKIAKEKAQLIKKGKIKKQKPLPEITEDETPFELPDGWEWVRLGDIGETNIGLTYSPIDISDIGTPVLRANNVQNGKLDLTDLVRVNKAIENRVIVQEGDLLICARSGSRTLVGKTAQITGLSEKMAFGAFMAIFRSRINDYLLHFINSPLFRRMIDEVSTTTINQITQNNLKTTIFPFPPHTEQIRIVAKVNQLMALCNELEIRKKKKKETRIALNDAALDTLLDPENKNEFSKHWQRIASNFDLLYDTPETVNKLRQAILQLAVQGKLVPQDPNDLPAPRPGIWFVYALECEDRSIYIGQTQDILKRWKQHATGKGADWTKRHPPIKLVHWEEYDSLEKAVKREKDLKTGFGRKWLKREYKAGRTRQAGEPASVLLDKIQIEKERLIKANKIKKTKPLPLIEADEVPFTIPDGWDWFRIGEIAKSVEYGTSQKASTENKGIPILRMNNIQNGKVCFENLKYVSESIKDLPRLYLKNNDILFNRTNSYELVGKAGIFKGANDAYTLASYLIRISLFTSAIDPDFFNISLNSGYFRETQIEPEITQQCGQANFNGTKLKNAFIPTPPYKEQKRIVVKVEQLMTLCDELETKLTQSQNDCDELLSAIVNGIENGESHGPSNKGSKSNNRHNIKTEKDAEIPEPVKDTFKSSSLERPPSQRKKQPKHKERFEKADVLRAYRKAIYRQTDIDESTLLRSVGRHLGINRLSKQFHDDLKSYIRTAIRRKIIVRNGDGFSPGTPTIQHYDDEHLIKTLRSRIQSGYEYPRDFLINELAKNLGFDRVSQALAVRMKTIFRMAIRQGLLYRNGSYVGKT